MAFNRGVVAHTMMMMMMMMRERGWGGERETNTSAGQVSRCPGPGEKIRSQTNTRPSLSPRLFGRRAGEKIYSQTNKTSIPRLRLSRKACRCPGVHGRGLAARCHVLIRACHSFGSFLCCCLITHLWMRVGIKAQQKLFAKPRKKHR